MMASFGANSMNPALSGPDVSSSLTPVEAARYDELFRLADTAGVGAVDGAAAVPFFTKADLPKDQLGQVWTLADHPASGSLDRRKFFVALRLISLAQSGQPIEVSRINTPGLPLPVFRGLGGGAPQPPTTAMPGASGDPTGMRRTSNPIPFQQTGVSYWTLTPANRQQYKQWFDQYDQDHDGFMTGMEAQQLLSKSTLPETDLRVIWSLSDMDCDGKLTLQEFGVAMHLVNAKRLGIVTQVPSTLPQELKHSVDIWRSNAGNDYAAVGNQPPHPGVNQSMPTAAAAAMAPTVGAVRSGSVDSTAAPAVAMHRTGTSQHTGPVAVHHTGASSALSGRTGGTNSGIDALGAVAFQRTGASSGFGVSSTAGSAAGTTPRPGNEGGAGGAGMTHSFSTTTLGTVAPPGAPWAVTEKQKARYDAYLKQYDRNGDGYVTMEEGRPFFAMTKLPDPTITALMKLCDLDGDGRLDGDEWAVAMHVASESVKNKKPIPTSLPDNLIPPSKRRLVHKPPSPQDAWSSHDVSANATPKAAPSSMSSTHSEVVPTLALGSALAGSKATPSSLSGSGAGAGAGAGGGSTLSPAVSMSNLGNMTPHSAGSRTTMTLEERAASREDALNKARQMLAEEKRKQSEIASLLEAEGDMAHDATTAELTQIKQQFEYQKMQTEVMQDKLEHSRKYAENLQEQRNAVQRKLRELQNAARTGEQELQATEQRTKQLAQELDDLQHDLQFAQSDYESQQGQLTEVKEAAAAVEKQRKSTADALAEVNKRIGDMNKQVERVKQETADTEKEIEQSEREMEEARQKLETIEGHVRLKQHQLDEVKVELQEKRGRLEEQIQTTEDKLAAKQNLDAELKEANEEVKRLDKEWNDQMQSITGNKSDEQKLKTELGALREYIKTHKEKLAEAKSIFREQTAGLHRLKQERGRAKSEKEQLQGVLQQLRVDVEKIKMEYKEIHKVMQEERLKHLQVRSEKEQLQNSLKHAQKKLHQATIELSEQRRRYEEQKRKQLAEKELVRRRSQQAIFVSPDVIRPAFDRDGTADNVSTATFESYDLASPMATPVMERRMTMRSTVSSSADPIMSPMNSPNIAMRTPSISEAGVRGGPMASAATASSPHLSAISESHENMASRSAPVVSASEPYAGVPVRAPIEGDDSPFALPPVTDVSPFAMASGQSPFEQPDDDADAAASAVGAAAADAAAAVTSATTASPSTAPTSTVPTSNGNGDAAEPAAAGDTAATTDAADTTAAFPTSFDPPDDQGDATKPSSSSLSESDAKSVPSSSLKPFPSTDNFGAGFEPAADALPPVSAAADAAADATADASPAAAADADAFPAFPDSDGFGQGFKPAAPVGGDAAAAAAFPPASDSFGEGFKPAASSAAAEFPGADAFAAFPDAGADAFAAFPAAPSGAGGTDDAFAAFPPVAEDAFGTAPAWSAFGDEDGAPAAAAANGKAASTDAAAAAATASATGNGSSNAKAGGDAAPAADAAAAGWADFGASGSNPFPAPAGAGNASAKVDTAQLAQQAFGSPDDADDWASRAFE